MGGVLRQQIQSIEVSPERNETFERYTFFKRNQEPRETTNANITAVLKLADTCNFGTLKESHIRDRLVSGIHDDSVRHKLLGKKDLTLVKCLDILRSSQVTHQRAQEISSEESATTHTVRRKQQSVQKRDDTTQSKPGRQKTKERKPKKSCIYCGLNHPPNKSDCPAVGKTRLKCMKKGYYARVCRSRNTDTQAETAGEICG